MEKKGTRPRTYFIFDTCAHMGAMVYTFDALAKLSIAITDNPIQEWECKSPIIQLSTYQLFREMTNTTEPGMGKLSQQAEQIKENPRIRKIVETPVCRHFLKLLQEECIKPQIIDPVLEGNEALQTALLEKAEQLRKIAKNANGIDLKPIQLFDTQGIIRNSYVVQALREKLSEGNNRLWDRMHETPRLSHIRKDAGEFSALAAITGSDLEENARVIFVTKDVGAKELIEDAYKGDIQKNLDKIRKSRASTPKGKDTPEKLILPYTSDMMLKSRRPEVLFANEYGFLGFCCAVEDAMLPHKKFLKKAYPSIHDALVHFRESITEFFSKLNESEQSRRSGSNNIQGLEVSSIFEIPERELAKKRRTHRQSEDLNL